MTDQLPAVFQQPGALSTRFASLPADNSELSEGVGGGFGVISIKGSKWRVKYKGEEFPVVDANGIPLPTLEVVLLKANRHLTKQFYATGYVDGSNAAPDCYSLDGVRPDPQAPSPQADACAACPHNQFGSRITDAGKKAKACSDTRRVAVVPLNDLQNDGFGGPMLLRVPPSALKGLQSLADMLKRRGYPYYAVAIRLGFDINASHPLPTFSAIRPLTDEEADTVMELRDSDACNRILADFVAEAAAPTEDAGDSDTAFEQPVAAPAARPVAPARPAAPKAPSRPFGPQVAPPAQPAAPRTPGRRGPVAAPATPATTPAPAAPAPQAPAKPFGNVTFASPAARKPAATTPAPVAEPTVEEVAAPEQSSGDLEADIANILASLSASPTSATA